MAEDDPLAANSTIPARCVDTDRRAIDPIYHMVDLKPQSPFCSFLSEARYLDLEDKIHKQLQRRLELEKYILELESQGADSGMSMLCAAEITDTLARRRHLSTACLLRI